MRFSLQDVKKSIHRHDGELAVSLSFLRSGELHSEIARLVAYHEEMLGQPQRLFSYDEAQACIGEYRLANCLIATLSNWYSWQPRSWSEVVQEMKGSPELLDFSPSELRLALYSYINEHYQGFVESQQRQKILQVFAEAYHLNTSDLEYLLVLDSENEALLTREASQPPDPQEVATLYNQWVFEAALGSASSVNFIIDCAAFARIESNNIQKSTAIVSSGVGAVIKRLCYLSRLLGVYYDLAYEPASSLPAVHLANGEKSLLLSLTLYGPQEVTGTPQQYGMRLARLCRTLLGYGLPKGTNAESGHAKRRSAFPRAIVSAKATVHFLQRTYHFVINPDLLKLLPSIVEIDQQKSTAQADPSQLFDSSIEQSFSEAFGALAAGLGVDGWQLEREPEPLLLDHGIFIPDFALTRNRQRIYVEVLGFWTPAYRERKVQKLEQLRGRTDLLLAIPIEAKASFTTIANDFPIVFYQGQLSVANVLQVLRTHYDDFTERLVSVDLMAVRRRVEQEGILPELACYELLHCYRRSEIQQVAERVCALSNEESSEHSAIAFVSGLGLYHQTWMQKLRQSLRDWMSTLQSVPLNDVVAEIKRQQAVLQNCEDAVIETLLGLWPEVRIQRSSIFDATVELVNENVIMKNDELREAVAVPEGSALQPTKLVKKQVREKRVGAKRHSIGEMDVVQGSLWN
jgi:predicted nuclease of restriction endonuclease-like RecB superfamily